MKVLYVVSGNSDLFEISPFIAEQTSSIAKKGIVIDFFSIHGKGFLGYLKNLTAYRRKIKEFNPDIIHAHYGLSGALANLQFKQPVITTFHGSDINLKRNKLFSRIAYLLSQHSIFVSEALPRRINAETKKTVIPCGLDLDVFFPIDKTVARETLKLSIDKKLILFSNSFTNFEKNYPLAKKATDLLKNENVELVELKGYSREEVNLLLNASDVALMTSFSEGSPQFIKEAMACNCPIVSTDVGDVKFITKDTDGCYITSYDATDVAGALLKALNFNGRTNGREKVEYLANDILADRIIEIYNKIVLKS